MKRILSFALLLAMVLSLSCLAYAQEEPATFVLKNGAVYTMNENLDVVSAIAVRGDEIVYVGDDEGAEAFIGADTKVVDLDGRMVTPGFISGHDHIAAAEYAMRTEFWLNNYESDLDIYKEAVEEYAAENPDIEVLNITGMDLQAYGDEIVNNQWLNEALPDRLAVVLDNSGHGRMLNQYTMDYLGITDDIEEPSGATIYRYEDGTLTGYFSDFIEVTGDLYSMMNLEDDDLWFEAFEEFEDNFTAAGLTTLDDGGSFPNIFDRLIQLDKAGDLRMRFQVPLMCNDTEAFSEEYAEECAEVLNGYQPYNSDHLRFGQVKMIIDGVPEGNSALLLEPYAETAGMGPDFYGPTYCSQETLDAMVSVFNENGYPVLVHSMGDGGCRKSIQAYIASQQANDLDDIRNVVVHATLISDEDIQAAGENNIYLAVQPLWFYMDPMYSTLELAAFGEERFYQEYNTRDRLEAGCIMTGGVDYCASWDYAPLTGIEVCATQGSPYEGEQGDPAFVRNEDQTISVMDALKMYTINGAMQCHMEDIIGTLEVGKKADMVILAEDITRIDVVDISETEIVNTIFDGRVVFGDEL